MLTIAPVVLSHHRRKDGTYNVKIRVTWKGVNKYIATNLWCSKDDLTRSLKIKTPAIVDAASRSGGGAEFTICSQSIFDGEEQILFM